MTLNFLHAQSANCFSVFRDGTRVRQLAPGSARQCCGGLLLGHDRALVRSPVRQQDCGVRPHLSCAWHSGL